MTSHSTPAAPIPVRWRHDLLLLTCLFGALYFFSAGRVTLTNPDEPRYAEIARIARIEPQ